MITKAVITKDFDVRNHILRDFVIKAYEKKEPAVLYVSHGRNYSEYRRAAEAVRRFLFLAGEFTDPTALGAVHSSSWLADEGRRVSWFRAQPINVQLGRTRKALIIDGDVDLPFGLLLKWGGPVVVIAACEQESLNPYAPSVRLSTLEGVVKAAEAVASANTMEEEEARFISSFLKFWSEDKKRQRNISLGMEGYITAVAKAIREEESDRVCYECENRVKYLFVDGRCKNCTLVTPEEVQGID